MVYGNMGQGRKGKGKGVSKGDAKGKSKIGSDARSDAATPTVPALAHSASNVHDVSADVRSVIPQAAILRAQSQLVQDDWSVPVFSYQTWSSRGGVSAVPVDRIAEVVQRVGFTSNPVAIRLSSLHVILIVSVSVVILARRFVVDSVSWAVRASELIPRLIALWYMQLGFGEVSAYAPEAAVSEITPREGKRGTFFKTGEGVDMELLWLPEGFDLVRAIKLALRSFAKANNIVDLSAFGLWKLFTPYFSHPIVGGMILLSFVCMVLRGQSDFLAKVFPEGVPKSDEKDAPDHEKRQAIDPTGILHCMMGALCLGVNLYMRMVNGNTRPLRICYLNADGVMGKTRGHAISALPADVIALCETHLTLPICLKLWMVLFLAFGPFGAPLPKPVSAFLFVMLPFGRFVPFSGRLIRRVIVTWLRMSWPKRGICYLVVAFWSLWCVFVPFLKNAVREAWKAVSELFKDGDILSVKVSSPGLDGSPWIWKELLLMLLWAVFPLILLQHLTGFRENCLATSCVKWLFLVAFYSRCPGPLSMIALNATINIWLKALTAEAGTTLAFFGRTAVVLFFGTGTHCLPETSTHLKSLETLRSDVMRCLLRRFGYVASPGMYFSLVASPVLNPYFSRVMDGLLVAWRAMKFAGNRVQVKDLFFNGDTFNDGPVARLRQVDSLSCFRGTVASMLEIPDDDFGTWLHDSREVWRRDQWRKVARDHAVFQGIEKGILKDVTLCYLRQLEQQGWSGPFDNGTFAHEQARMKAAVLRLLLTGGLFTRDMVSQRKTKKETVCDCSVGGPADVFHVSWKCAHYASLRAPISHLSRRLCRSKSCFHFATIVCEDDADVATDVVLIQTTLVNIWQASVKNYLYGDLGPGVRGSAEVVAQPAVEPTGEDAILENGHHIVAMMGGGATDSLAPLHFQGARPSRDSVVADGTAILPPAGWLEPHSFASVPEAAALPGTKILTIADQPISKTAQSEYLGALLGLDRAYGVDADEHRRVSLAHTSFSKLRHLWRSREISLKTKLRMLLSCVAAVLLYSSETWTVQYPHHRPLHSTWMTFVIRAQRLRYSDMQALRLDSEAVLKRLGKPSVFTLLGRRSAQWLGHTNQLMPFCLAPFLPELLLLLVREEPTVITTLAAPRWCCRLSQSTARSSGLARLKRVAWHYAVKRIKIAALGRHAPPADRARVHAHGGVALRVVAFQCPICPYRGRNSQGLSRHLNLVRPVVRDVYRCPTATKLTGTKATSRRTSVDVKPGTCLPHRLRQCRVKLELAPMQL
ncbi:unnamed protein product [Symbiodinium sp. CCMP2592]|nr:unnamed protein product [Symbiodinium sp. CCMP2592]